MWGTVWQCGRIRISSPPLLNICGKLNEPQSTLVTFPADTHSSTTTSSSSPPVPHKTKPVLSLYIFADHSTSKSVSVRRLSNPTKRETMPLHLNKAPTRCSSSAWLHFFKRNALTNQTLSVFAFSPSCAFRLVRKSKLFTNQSSFLVSQSLFFSIVCLFHSSFTTHLSGLVNNLSFSLFPWLLVLFEAIPILILEKICLLG